MYYSDRKKIKTVIDYSADITESSDDLFCDSLNYRVEAFYMINIDGDEKYKEVFTMTDIGKMIYEDGLKDGEERGEKRGKALSVIKLLTKKFGKLPQGYNDKIMELNDIILDLMITDILDYKSLEDFKKYFD